MLFDFWQGLPALAKVKDSSMSAFVWQPANRMIGSRSRTGLKVSSARLGSAHSLRQSGGSEIIMRRAHERANISRPARQRNQCPLALIRRTKPRRRLKRGSLSLALGLVSNHWKAEKLRETEARERMQLVAANAAAARAVRPHTMQAQRCCWLTVFLRARPLLLLLLLLLGFAIATAIQLLCGAR